MARRRGSPIREAVHWQFFTFPVGFAFVLGMFVTTLLLPVINIVFIVSLFLTSFGIAHIIGHWFRRRTLDRARERAEEDERERRGLEARAAREEAAAAAAPAASPVRRRRRRRT
jgi:hypothetical protein